LIHRHLTDEELLLVLEEESPPRPDCIQCSERLDQMADWLDKLRKPELWDEVPMTVTPPPMSNDLAGIIALDVRLRSEAQQAHETIEQLDAVAIADWPETLRNLPQSSGLAAALIDAARARFHQSPRDAQAILDLAAKVLAVIKPPAVSTEAELYKQRANAYRLLGDFHAALAAIDRAEQLYRTLPVPAYDLAFVAWCRGSIYSTMKRFSEAKRELQSAAKTFQAYGDEIHLSHVRGVEGVVLYDEGDIAAAREIFREVAAAADRFDDMESLARQYHNIASCDLRLGDFATAREHAERATTLYEQLEMPSEAVRLQWSIGDALSETDPDKALHYLRDAASRFEQLGMTADAAMAHLDTLGILLAQGDTATVAQLAAHIAALFTREGMQIDAAHAIDYLRRAVNGNEATPALVRYVHDYVEQRVRGDEVTFEPPLQ